MGTKFGGLTRTVESNLSSLDGDTIAIDGHIMMHQFLHSITDDYGEYLRNDDGEPISHLIGFMSRMAPVIDHGIRPIVVFDGGYPELKDEEVESRRNPEAEAKFEEAKANGNTGRARKYAHRKVVVTDPMLDSVTELLEAMGIPVVQAPAEGEPQCVQLMDEGTADYAVSEDWDTLMYGPDVMLRDFNTSGFDRVSLSDTLSNHGWSFDQLQWFGILLGSDYNRSPKGVGYTYGKRIVADADSFQDVIDAGLEYDDSFDPERWHRVYELFQNPSVERNIDLDWNGFDREAVNRVAQDKYDLSRRQVSQYLEDIDASAVAPTP